MVKVPQSSVMDDETFRKHLEARHIPCGDFSDLKSFRAGSHFTANRSTFEAYHQHLHKEYDYNHEHAR